MLDARSAVSEIRGVTSFHEATQLTALGAGRYGVIGDASWAQGRGIYGGLVAALFARALEREAGPGQRLVRMTTAFTAPFLPGAAELRVEVVRAGRNVACLRATLTNDGGDAPAASCLATLARPREPSAIERHTHVMPEVPSPSDVPDGPSELYIPTFASRFEFRQCVGSRPFSGGTDARLGGWCRSREGAPFDPALVVALLDAWAPAAVGVSSGWCPVASLEMSVHFLVPLPLANDPPDAWIFFDARCDHAADGVADERATIFDAHGRALATCQQLIAILPAPA